jgi:glucose-6-phosphate 1-dehydrogenase
VPDQLTTLVILGARGDMTGRLLLPALVRLADAGDLPADTRILAIDRDAGDDGAYREHARQKLADHLPDGDDKTTGAVLDRLGYRQADVTSADALRAALKDVAAPMAVYLALPNVLFRPTLEALAAADLPPHTKLVVEKPFGADLEDAIALNAIIGHSFDERDVFRIDHFLAKQTVLDVLGLRFANRIFEPVWNGDHISRVDITWFESLGLEGRASYYDRAGALRDMIQNHLVQMMTFATMEPPALWDAEMLRDHKVEVLKAVRAPDPEVDAVRGQYTAGLVEGVPRIAYRAEPGVDPTSRTDTFAALRLHLDTWRWEGVPVVMRSGKRLASKAHEVAYRFKEPPTRLFRHTPLEHAEPNWLVFRMSPKECTELVVRTKQPGLDLEARESVLRAEYTEEGDHEASAYEQLLLEVLNGDHTPFLRFDEVEWSWRIVDPVLKAWQTGAPEDYVAGSDGPAGQHRFLGVGHSWRPLNPPAD